MSVATMGTSSLSATAQPFIPNLNGINGAQASASSSSTSSMDSSLMSAIHKYRGAVVEDLQLPPAFALPSTEYISRAIELAYERDFSYIPILTHERKPLGYVDVAALKASWEGGEAQPTDSVIDYTTKFQKGPSQPYTLITPSTPLAELESFLKKNSFALVTDDERKFVLAVVTLQDLESFVSRRGRDVW